MHGETTPQAPTSAPRRALKLVATLRPSEGAGFLALLGVGAEGCDPLLRRIEVADLAAALDELPGLLAEAEARWQAQPRYPAAALSRKAGAGAKASQPKEAVSPPPEPEPRGADDCPAKVQADDRPPDAGPAPGSPAGGQLALFG